mgnify:CR=1 FL=1
MRKAAADLGPLDTRRAVADDARLLVEFLAAYEVRFSQTRRSNGCSGCRRRSMVRM